MKFIKKLFQKKEEEFQPSNRIEELLKKASEDPAFRPDFYRQIFHFDLFVIGRLDEENGEKSLSMQTREYEGALYSYAYTSLDALKFMLRNSKEEMNYVQIPATTFFEMCIQQNLGFVLNMNLPFGRIFNPQEVQGIYHNDRELTQEKTIEKETQVQVGIPAKEPVNLIKALRSLVEKESFLNDIFLGLQIVNGESSYILVLKTSKDDREYEQRVVQDLGIILSELEVDLPVDISPYTSSYKEIVDQNGLLSCLNYPV